ncbi:alpha-amylase family glycosyl hydrolase [Streptomyces nigra]
MHEPYGGPEALKRFVDRAHSLGLGVVLDVVHNHFGPSGNHLPAFGPYLTDRHQTPWGPPSTSTRPARTRCATTWSAARWPGCGTTGSTGCAWTRCTRSSTRARSTSWRSCRRPSTPSPPTWAARCR